MRKRDRKALGKYIRHIANEMELRDWTIELSADPAPEGCEGYVRNTYGRKLAIIQVAPDFREQHGERQRHTVVHELVHCHMEAAGNMIRNDLEEHLGKQADGLFWDAFKRQLEYGVDGLASALAKHQPLIDWPK